MILNVKNLGMHYQQGPDKVVALNDISFQMEKGETLAITGTSGSGKTTLLSLLAGLDSPTHGQVFVDSREITAMDEKSLSAFRGQKMGVVFQQFHLMSYLNALENVCLPLEIGGEKEVIPRAKEALEQVGLSHRWQHRPDQLSGGECQRVAIARALVGNPQILLADEPSGSLDTKTGEAIMNLLLDLVSTQKMTMVLVTHNPSHAKLCQRSIVLNAGCMV